VTSGLRRFVGPAPETTPAAPPQERCEMCGEPVVEEHGHVVDVENRSLMCACRPCYLLFTAHDAGAGRYRAVPDRCLTDPAHSLTKLEWDALGIPVASAFFLRSADATISAFYPSPAGATECLLDLEAWARLEVDHPLLTMAQPDVEAILVRDTEVTLVPVDVCYQLVGIVRMYWQGFDGGEEARVKIDEFFAGIAARVRPLPGA
jgi:hypothetical protein